ncbi:hypothetical protein pb186bvf_006070 [Paramecium bursaria]
MENNDKQIEMGQLQIEHQKASQADSDFIKSKSTIKIGQAIIISNLIGFVIILFYLMIFYALNRDVNISLIIFIISDVIFICQDPVGLYYFINKHHNFIFTVIANIISVFLKIVGIILQLLLDPKLYLIAPGCMMLLQLLQSLSFRYVQNNWSAIPQKKWKKNMILVRKKKEIKNKI